MNEIKFIKETACIMLTKDGESIDSVFFNKLDYEQGYLTIEQVKNESSKLASTYNINEYILNTENF